LTPSAGASGEPAVAGESAVPGGDGGHRQDAIPWDLILGSLQEALETAPLPAVSEVAARRRDPFYVLVSTMISLRTKDEVTARASERLLARASTPREMADLDPQEIGRLIFPAGFYNTKARHLHEAARILERDYGGQVPSGMEQLLALPGVGRKTANLVRNLGFGLDGICVDTHVHRISNRLGWVRTRTPGETETALEAVLPRRHWIPINELLVSFGQRICTPLSPRCSSCPIGEHCPRVGVTRSR
jgi:endonuclease-3